MTRPVDLSSHLAARRWLRAQTWVALALTAALLAVSPVAAYSSMFGSLAAYLPALAFTLIVAPRFGSDSGAFLRAAVVGEVVKLAFTVVICAAVFAWVEPLAPGWFFVGLIAVIVAGLTGLILSQ